MICTSIFFNRKVHIYIKMFAWIKSKFRCIISGKWKKSLIRQTESLLLLGTAAASKRACRQKHDSSENLSDTCQVYVISTMTIINLHTYLYEIIWNCDRFGPPTTFLVSLFLSYSISDLVETFKMKSLKNLYWVCAWHHVRLY